MLICSYAYIPHNAYQRRMGGLWTMNNLWILNTSIVGTVHHWLNTWTHTPIHENNIHTHTHTHSSCYAIVHGIPLNAQSTTLDSIWLFGCAEKLLIVYYFLFLFNTALVRKVDGESYGMWFPVHLSTNKQVFSSIWKTWHGVDGPGTDWAGWRRAERSQCRRLYPWAEK